MMVRSTAFLTIQQQQRQRWSVTALQCVNKNPLRMTTSLLSSRSRRITLFPRQQQDDALVTPQKYYFCHKNIVTALSSSTQNHDFMNGTYDDDNKLLQQELQSIQQKLTQIISTASPTPAIPEPINLNSPKQVAQILYNDNNNSAGGGTAKKELQKMVSGKIKDEYTQYQQQVAQLVLDYREISGMLKRRKNMTANGAAAAANGTSSRFFSTASSSTLNGSNEKSESATTTKTTADERAKNKQAQNIIPKNNNKPSSSPTSYSSSSSLSNNNNHYQEYINSLYNRPKSILAPYFQSSLSSLTKPSAKNLVHQLNPFICPMGYDPNASPFHLFSIDDKYCTQQEGKKNGGGGRIKGGGSLLEYVREKKRKHLDCVVITRVGDFYECFGLDAILLVEHCGLNPMAGKARAGCPVKNIQPTLDCLTAAGFRVAVYEEAADTDASVGVGASGGSKSRLKNRMLAQIVTSASPTYLYDLVLGNSDTLVTSPASRPYIGVVSTSAGYTVVEVSSEEQNVRISERLTAEAVACRLAAYPPADPLFYVPSPGEEELSSPYPISARLRQLPFLPSRSDAASEGSGSFPRIKILPLALMQEPAPGLSDLERARRVIVKALIEMTENYDGDIRPDGRPERRVTHEDFVLVSSDVLDGNDDSVCSTSYENGMSTFTYPLYVETATQLGLMYDATIPPLVKYLLPDSAPATTRRYLRRWLLTPPPPLVAGAMSNLVRLLKDDGPALPPLTVPPIGKVLALIRAGEASSQVYHELLDTIDSTALILEAYYNENKDSNINGDGSDTSNSELSIIDPLMVLLQHESGMAADPHNLMIRCKETIRVIEDVVSSRQHVQYYSDDESIVADRISSFGDLIPDAFFDRNEANWRGRVKPEAAESSYAKVNDAAERLAIAVAIDFWGIEAESRFDLLDLPTAKESKTPIVQDIFNNIFAIKDIPSWADNSEGKYFHPRDRNGKLLRNRYMTTDVENALSDYIESCEDACKQVKAVLTKLSQTICDEGHLPAVVQASHTNLILSTAAHHASNSNALGWHMARTFEMADNEDDQAGHFVDLWPYWMDKSEAVANSFDLRGLFLLTAPNMSGKSTLMRSTAAAALLSNCGLCAPLGPNSSVRRFDSIFVRGASSDVPTEDKSAFGAEMGDIAALMRSCGNRSLVFVDELGRGTSPKDGTSLAGAVLEAMAEKGMSGIFATHLHGLLNLPLVKPAQDRIKKKRMAIHDKQTDENTDLVDEGSTDVEWTYLLEDGVCTDSLALVTAAKFGLSDEILKRAKALSRHVEETPHSVVKNGLRGDSVISSLSPAGDLDQTIKNSNKIGLEQVMRITEEVTGENGQAIRIPPKWMAPASMEGCSCVYVLEICNSEYKNQRAPPRYYVGETDSLSQRLSQHRCKGKDWASLSAIAVRVGGGKTEARNIESLVIRKMAKAGFDLVSVSDGRSIRSNQG